MLSIISSIFNLITGLCQVDVLERGSEKAVKIEGSEIMRINFRIFNSKNLPLFVLDGKRNGFFLADALLFPNNNKRRFQLI